MTTSSLSNLKESSLFQHLSNRRGGYLMKKSLSLLAIFCLVLSMGLVSQVLANAPVYPEVPSVKLYTNNVGLTPAFDLAWFNTAPDGFNGDKATSYSMTANFLGENSLGASSFSGYSSIVQLGGYSHGTDGSNSFSITNAGGTATPTDKVKYSTYVQYEYGRKIGLSVGETYTQAVASYTAGNVAALAPSFGSANALIVSDTTKVSAVWSGNTAVIITLLATTTSPVDVDIIASPVATGAIGADQDRERVEVYSNLLANGTFSTANDTTAWGLQIAPGSQWTNEASQTWVASTTDSAGNPSNPFGGVWVFNFASNSYGIKGTPFPANYIPMNVGQWYTARMKVADAVSGNNDICALYGYCGTILAGSETDIGAEQFNPLPTTWTWVEAPLQVHQAGHTGYPQFIMKAGQAGSIFVNEFQVIQATPRIFSGSRGNVRSFLTAGLFAQSTSTTLWGQQLYNQAVSAPTMTLTSDTAIGSALSANYAGASGSSLIGFKWTLSQPGGGINTPAVTVGRQAGVTMEIDIASGLNGGSELDQALVGLYGTSANGGSAIEQLDCAAEIGTVLPGTLQTAGFETYPYVQVQFEMRGESTGVANFSNVDLVEDTNDPNFGDINLFP